MRMREMKRTACEQTQLKATINMAYDGVAEESRPEAPQIV